MHPWPNDVVVALCSSAPNTAIAMAISHLCEGHQPAVSVGKNIKWHGCPSVASLGLDCFNYSFSLSHTHKKKRNRTSYQHHEAKHCCACLSGCYPIRGGHYPRSWVRSNRDLTSRFSSFHAPGTNTSYAAVTGISQLPCSRTARATRATPMTLATQSL